MICVHKNKSIGNVLFIVEGEKTEFSILRKVFCNILGYSFIGMNRRGYDTFIDNDNKNSRVAVINTKYSNISSISGDEDYLDQVFDTLNTEYHFPIDKAAIYFLFDRDPESNTDSALIRNYIKHLQNPYDNADYSRAGQILLSYPSIETFTASAFIDGIENFKFGTGKELKAYLSHKPEVQLNKMSEEGIKKATDEFIRYVNECNESFDVDDFSETSIAIFDREEKIYERSKVYDLFSMLMLAFLQLGIVEVV